MLFLRALEVAEVVADFGVGPVGVADDFAADDAFSVDDVGFWPTVGAVELGDFLVGIADGVEIDVKSSEEAAVRAGVFVDADGEDGEVGAVVMEFHQGRRFLDAGRALAPPEIQQDYFAAVVGETDGVFAVADGEVGATRSAFAGIAPRSHAVVKASAIKEPRAMKRGSRTSL